jgi:hypothetical protein
LSLNRLAADKILLKLLNAKTFEMSPGNKKSNEFPDEEKYGSKSSPTPSVRYYIA